jgi:quinol-cytochrome oxidoreductase complex cytochrome b subunit
MARKKERTSGGDRRQEPPLFPLLHFFLWNLYDLFSSLNSCLATLLAILFILPLFLSKIINPFNGHSFQMSPSSRPFLSTICLHLYVLCCVV